MNKIKAPKMKKKAIKLAESVEDTEKPLTENDTQEIHDFIKGLGLDQFGPEGMPEESSSASQTEKSFKAKKSAVVKPSKDFQKPVDRATPKSQANKVAEPKSKKIQAKQSEDSASGLKIDLSKPPQNKKIIFDKSQKKDFNNHKYGDEAEGNGVKIDLSKPPQNKKIVFDDTLLSASSTSKKQEDQSTGPFISTGPPQNKKIVFDESYIVGDQPLPDKDEAWYNLLISPDKPWYQQGKKLKSDGSEPSPEEISKCEAEGKRYLEEDTANFLKVRAVGSDKSENRWMQTVLKSGAFTDKIAAHTILLQESAAHNLQSLKFLISLLDVKGRRECLASLDALLRLFTEGRILNPDAKLNLLNRQPVKALSTLPIRERKETLALWSFEHQLKDLYNQFIQALDGLLKDSVETTRRKTIAVIATLLAHCPEQEQSLLNRLVNKVGDPTRGVATTAVAQMEKILEKHSNMKTVIVAEVERLLYRPNIDTKAQYYALCFLSQILLDEEDIPLATKLVIIYVSFFKACVKKGEVDSKLMSALLTGLRRAFPYTKSQGPGGPLEAHVATLFKMLYMVQFRLAIQVLCILDQIAQKDPTNSDKFYSGLFYKLLDPGLALSTRQSMFLNLVYCALKRDESVTRLRTFVKRILQVCMSCPVQLACGFLFLVSELMNQRPEIKTFTAVAVRTFVVEDDDDEEEHYKDIEDEEEGDGEQQKEQSTTTNKDTKDDKAAVSTWIHRNNTKQKTQEKTGYDALVRNPLFGKAEQSGGLWEMTLLTEHFHPSVALFAKHIIEGTRITYSGDPLQDFTLVRFLDRFVFRNPRSVSASDSKMVPIQRRVLGKRSQYTPTGVRALAVDSKQFTSRPKHLIPVDEMFLYQYFKRRVSKGPKLEKDEDNSDIESVASEEFEQYLADSADIDFAADMKPKSTKTKKRKSAEDDEEDDEDEEGEDDLEAAELDSEDDFEQDEDFEDAFKEFDEMLDEVAPEVGQEGEMSDQDEDGEEVPFNEEDVEFSDDEDGSVEGSEDDDDEDEEMPAPSKSKGTKTKGKKRAKADYDDGDDLDWAFEEKPSIISNKKTKRNRDLFDTNGLDFVAAEDFAAMLESNATPGLNTGGTTEALSNKDKASVKQLQWEMSRDRWMKDLNRPKNRTGGQHKKKRGGVNGKFKSGPAFRKNRAKRGGKV